MHDFGRFLVAGQDAAALQAINSYRASAGLAALTANAALDTAARANAAALSSGRSANSLSPSPGEAHLMQLVIFMVLQYYHDQFFSLHAQSSPSGSVRANVSCLTLNQVLSALRALQGLGLPHEPLHAMQTRPDSVNCCQLSF